MILFVPSFEFGLVICGNADGLYHIAQAVSKELLDELLDVPSRDRTDWAEREADLLARQEESLDNRDKLREEIGDSGRKIQEQPLDAYIGIYHNAGYHNLEVQQRDGCLHIDASDRSNPISIDFEHVRDDRYFIATLRDDNEVITYLKADFAFDAENKISAMGIDLCEEMKGKFIWFQRIGSSS